MDGRRPGEVRWYGLLFLGVAGVAGAITLLFRVMSAVMEVGGSCGSGGPYVIRTECPGGVGPSVLLAIFGGLAALGLTLAATSRLDAPPVVLLGWPVLFGLLGANFLRYGIDPPGDGGTEIGLLITGIVFELMALGPLWIGASMLRDRRRSERARSSVPDVGASSTVRYTWNGPITPTFSMTTTAATSVDQDDGRGRDDGDGFSDGDDLVESLERLADLHRRGALTDAEFAAAKLALLSGER